LGSFSQIHVRHIGFVLPKRATAAPLTPLPQRH
jgi:hypothetical protein